MLAAKARRLAQRSVWVWAILNLLVLYPAVGATLLDVKCANEAGVGSHAHEQTLDRLNGRSVVLLGDSVTRYQYLELAYYIVYGYCPSRETLPGQYILSEQGWESWDAFYKASSEQLTARTDKIVTSEHCFCSRAFLWPGRVHEARTFRYNDFEVRQLRDTFCWRRSASGNPCTL